MDITIDVDDYKLNVRAAGVMIHNGKILVHRNVNSDHYALIGGRVEIGESSANTIKREIKEELGKQEVRSTADGGRPRQLYQGGGGDGLHAVRPDAHDEFPRTRGRLHAARARARRRPTDEGRRACSTRHPRIFAGQRAA